MELVASAPADTIAKAFDLGVSALAQCVGRTWSETDAKGVKTTYSVSDLSFPKLGQDSRAYRMSIRADMGILSMDLVFVRNHTALVLIAGVSGTVILLGGGQIDAKELEDIARKAVAKVDAATG
jgi:hypothetical protein